MADTGRLILASASPFRRRLLEAAGVAFDVIPAKIDERSVEKQLTAGGGSVEASDVAMALAVAKGVAVSKDAPSALVIGCDQVMSFEGALLSKAESVSLARQQVMRLRGKMHTLHSGICLVKGGEPVWTHVDVARMTMRTFSDAWLEAYVARMGNRLCQTVGGYEIEAEGVNLFERVEGDHFTVIGLPLLPLLAKLRALKVIEA